MCDEIRLTLAEVRRRTPSAVPAWAPRGTTPRLTVRGTTAGAPPPPPPPHITSHYITSRHITSRHVTSHHITSHHMASHHITSHHITSHHITSHHIKSRHITSHHITSHHTTSHHITSPHITSHHITPHHTGASHLRGPLGGKFHARGGPPPGLVRPRPAAPHHGASHGQRPDHDHPGPPLLPPGDVAGYNVPPVRDTARDGAPPVGLLGSIARVGASPPAPRSVA